MGYQVNIRKQRRDGSHGWELKWQKDFGNGKREQRHICVLSNSKLRVKVSDCVRTRANGENEVDGVKPDVLLEMTNLNSTEFSKASSEAELCDSHPHLRRGRFPWYSSSDIFYHCFQK